MNKPYIFAHRGVSGYCIENTMDSFQKATEMKVGIETDIQITKDNVLVCFHDPSFKIDNTWYVIRKLTLESLKSLDFEDNREIPTLNDVFDAFSYCPNTLRYSCDIITRKTGLALIDMLNKFSNFKQVEITDTRLYVLKNLRNYCKSVKLVFTIPSNISDINNKTIKFESLIDNNIEVLNLNINHANRENFRNTVKNGFKCYVWGVDTQAHMKKVLNLRENGEFIRAIYTNYPDLLKKKRDEIFN